MAAKDERAGGLEPAPVSQSAPDSQPGSERQPLRRAALGVGVVVLLGAAAFCVVHGSGDGARAGPGSAEVLVEDGASNVLPADYLGPEACKACHEDIYQSWQSHPHSVMNQWAGPQSVKADFSGASIHFRGGTARFDEAEGRYTMTLKRGDIERGYVVTRTVGSRFTQFFIGKQIKGPEPAEHELYTTEHRLPFAYWFRIKRWLPQSYFDPWGPDRLASGKPKRDPFARPDPHPYRQNCMICHTTYPYLYRLGHFPVRRGFPPDDLAFDDKELWAEWKKTVDLGTLYEDKLSRRWSPDKHLVRMGISCESCHFGGRAHVADVRRVDKFPHSDKPAIAVRPSDDETKLQPSWSNAYLVNGICRQCHSAEGKTYPNGAAVGNSREALDLDAGECASEMRCTHCHSPHRSIGLKPPDPDPAHLQACKGCHASFDDDAFARKHSAHPPEAGVSCMDCHMPRMAQGIDAIVRSHRISSPTNRDMLAAASVNACNLCHLDRSIQWTVEQLNARYDAGIALDPDWQVAYRGFTEPLGPLWLMSDRHAERQAAVAAYARSPLGKQSLPLLLARLNDVAPVNRVFALFAVQELLGRDLSVGQYDPTLPPAQRQRQIDQLMQQQADAEQAAEQ